MARCHACKEKFSAYLELSYSACAHCLVRTFFDKLGRGIGDYYVVFILYSVKEGDRVVIF